MEVPEEQSREKAEPRHHSERLVQSVHTHTVQKLVGRPARARLPEFSELLHFEKNSDSEEGFTETESLPVPVDTG